MRNLLFIILTVTGFYSNAQLQTAHWYFGQGAGLDFTSGSPVVDLNGQINVNEGTSSISDREGNLLFYTDGMNVYNRNHSLMPNGTGLNGSGTSSQSAIIVPKPNSNEIYYIFTFNGSIGAYYTVVDMSLDSGNGAILPSQKNLSLSLGSIVAVGEKGLIIPKLDCSGYWMVTHSHVRNSFYAFSITSEGVNTAPVVSPGFQSYSSLGYLRASPNGSRIAITHANNPSQGSLAIYDFDNDNGTISNQTYIYSPSSGINRSYYGLEFSPNSKVLYASFDNGKIVQYDLTASNIQDSEYILDHSTGFGGALLLGPNNKIYAINTNSTSHLSVIHNPNIIFNSVTGVTPYFEENSVYLGGRFSALGLPTFPTLYFHSKILINGLENSNFCYGDEFEFTHESCELTLGVQALEWDLGDGTLSSENNISHVYEEPGTYTVTLTLYTGIGEQLEPHQYVTELTIHPLPVAFDAELKECLDLNGNSVEFDLTESYPQINPNGESLTITFYETEQEAEEGTNPPLPTIYTTATTTTLWARAENEWGCVTVVQLNLLFHETPTLEITSPIELCINHSVELSVETATENEVLWYDSLTGATPIFTGNPFETPVLNATTSYWVEVISEEGCASEREEIIVEIVDSIVPEFDLDEQYCVGSELIDLPNLSENNISGTWNPAQIDTSIIGIQTFTFTPDEGQCAEEFPLEIEVTDAIEPIFDLDFEYCQSEELITLPTQSDNGITGVWTPSQIDTSVVGIQNFTFNPDDNQCAEQFPFSVEIFENQVAEFDLIDEYCLGLTPQTLENVSDNGVSGTWFPAQIDTNTIGTTIYTFTPDGICGEDFILEINILDETIPEFNFSLEYCLNSEEITLPTTSNNGVSGTWFPAIVSTNNLGTTIYEFIPDLECGIPITKEITIVEIILPEFDDLIQNYCLNSDEIQALPNLSDNGISGTWFPSQIDTSIQGTTTYTFTPDDGQCSEDFELNVTVYPHPDMDLEEELLICEGDSFTYTAPDGFDSYQWKDEQNQIISQSQTVTFTQEGIYTLTVEINGIPCDLSRSIEVRFSTPPTITEIKTTENTLTVYATGGNPLEYSMNEVFWQSSPTFTNLQPGIYHVYVRDAKGCSTTAKQAGLLGTSNFISPNGDGYNDTWKIRGLEAYPNTRLQIFDRNGKIFVDKIIDSSFSWDGKYNGQPLPSGAYWYLLILEDGEKISGHISIRNY